MWRYLCISRSYYLFKLFDALCLRLSQAMEYNSALVHLSHGLEVRDEFVRTTGFEGCLKRMSVFLHCIFRLACAAVGL